MVIKASLLRYSCSTGTFKASLRHVHVVREFVADALPA